MWNRHDFQTIYHTVQCPRKRIIISQVNPNGRGYINIRNAASNILYIYSYST